VIGILATVGWGLLWVAFPKYLGDALILVLGFLLIIILTSYVLLTPYLNYRTKGDLIDREMHLFITRMGVLSASEASRKEMFEVLASMREYGMLAQEIDKIFTLVSRWNVGLEKACRTVANQTPSELFSNFLLRLAHAVETGETAEEFFEKEQTVVMDQYEIRYESSMRSIEIIKEVFIIMVVLFLMILILISFIPFLTKEDMAPWIVIMGAGFVALDLIIMYILGEVVPGERIWHNMKMRTQVEKEISRNFQIAVVASLALTGIMIALWPQINYGLEQIVRRSLDIPAGGEVPQNTVYVIPLIILSVGMIPLLWPSGKVMGEEAKIKKRDAQYPAFIRSLGGAVGARSKSITLPLKKLRQHDFGPLRKNVDDLYKRLSIRIKSERAWEYFAAETQSELISKFNEMYVEGARTGDTKKISKIISDNFIRILGLREMKYESGSTFLWMLYGLTLSMSFLMYFGLYIVEQFANLFRDISLPENSGMEPLFFFKEALVNIPVLWVVMWVALVIHCALAALMVKTITGGHRMAAGAHFVGMLWTGTVTSVLVMFAAQFLIL
jgi:flagellar protein FlaJ